MKSNLIPRWNPIVNSINKAFSILERLAKQVKLVKKGKGRKPKQGILRYAILIALKEFDKRSLREAEVHLSRFVCGDRVDHSVIGYWENKVEMKKLICKFITIAGSMLDKVLSSLFVMIDATKFSSWNIKEVEFTLCNRVVEQTLYPIGISFLTNNVRDPVNECLPKGNKILYADAWYDDNKALGVMFKKGYVPVVCPNKMRSRGYYRKRARKIYNQPVHRLGYRQRGRGESVFGSLTNRYGNRLNTRNKSATQTRIAARVLSYQIKILIRVNNFEIMLILRHAPKSLNQKY